MTRWVRPATVFAFMGASIYSRRLLTAVVSTLAVAAVLVAGASAFNVSDKPPPPGVVGIPYKFVFEPEDGAPPYSYRFFEGELPPGLRVDPDGTMQGTPTRAGSYIFTIQGTQCCGQPSERGFEVVIRDRLTITTAGLPSGNPGAPYSATISVTGHGGKGMGWALASGSLPPGLTLASAGTPYDGVISGTPTTSGTYSFTVSVGDTDGFVPSRTVTRAYTLAIVVPLSTALAANSSPVGIVGKAYKATLVTASGGIPPYSWSVGAGSPPPGLSLDPAGALVGTPAAPGTFPFAITATDTTGRTSSTPVSVTIVGKLDIMTTTLRNARVGKLYRSKLRSTGGAAPLRWQVTKGKLPAGIRLEAATGILSGTPKKEGTTSFTVAVTDALGQKSSERLALAVAP